MIFISEQLFPHVANHLGGFEHSVLNDIEIVTLIAFSALQARPSITSKVLDSWHMETRRGNL